MENKRITTGGIVSGLLVDSANVFLGWPKSKSWGAGDSGFPAASVGRIANLRHQLAFLLCFCLGWIHLSD